MNNIHTPKLLLCLSIIAISTAWSCSTGYGVANLTAPTGAMHKPNYTDTTSQKVKANYVQATVAIGDGYGDEDDLESYSISLYQSVVKKRYDLSTGAFGYYGNYHPTSFQAPLNRDVSFYGLGVTHEGNLRVGRSKKWWHLGYKASLWYEDGNYFGLREQAEDIIPGFFNKQPSKVNLYLGYKVSWHPYENLGFYYSAGSVVAQEAIPVLGIGSFIKHQRWTFDVNVVVTDFTTANFGFHYRLK